MRNRIVTISARWFGGKSKNGSSPLRRILTPPPRRERYPVAAGSQTKGHGRLKILSLALSTLARTRFHLFTPIFLKFISPLSSLLETAFSSPIFHINPSRFRRRAAKNTLFLTLFHWA